jgi:hypothetical protein
LPVEQGASTRHGGPWQGDATPCHGQSIRDRPHRQAESALAAMESQLPALQSRMIFRRSGSVPAHRLCGRTLFDDLIYDETTSAIYRCGGASARGPAAIFPSSSRMWGAMSSLIPSLVPRPHRLACRPIRKRQRGTVVRETLPRPKRETGAISFPLLLRRANEGEDGRDNGESLLVTSWSRPH